MPDESTMQPHPLHPIVFFPPAQIALLAQLLHHDSLSVM